MFISPLFNKMRGTSAVTLILKKDNFNLQYFMLASTVGYSVVTTGTFEGDMEDGVISFTLTMDTVASLMDKGIKFGIEYRKGNLIFTSLSGAIRITPMYVETLDDKAQYLMKQFIEFDTVLDAENKRMQRDEIISDLTREIRVLQSNLQALEISNEIHFTESVADKAQQMDIGQQNSTQGYAPSDTPFGGVIEVANPVTRETSYNKDFVEERIKQVKQEIKNKEQTIQLMQRNKSDESNLHLIDIASFKKLADVAAKAHEFVALCGTFATVSLKDCYLIQKGDCPIKGMTGWLLNQLLSEDGTLYMKDDAIIYDHSVGGVTTRVFVEPYLPNSKVDLSLITKGKLLEKYEVEVKEIASIVNVVMSKYTSMYFDMNNATFVMESSQSERVNISFTIKSADTLALRQVESGRASGVNLTMARFYLPKEVAKLFTLFRSGLTIYVKDRKILFESDKLFVVFGRSNVEIEGKK